MKIKIGNFNFINDKENRLNRYTDLETKYFYLDGKEDTLFAKDNYFFERTIYDLPIPEYEKSLLEKYEVVSIYKNMGDQINTFIENKVNEIFKNQSYSRYELYKNISIPDIECININNDFKFNGFGLEINFDTNRIINNDFIFNPYTLEIENLDEKFKEGKFKKYIKDKLIEKEIENRIAPPFILEILKIDDFLNDKKTVNLCFKGYETFKANAQIRNFLYLENERIEINLSYSESNNFYKSNPNKYENELKLENLRGISYGKNILEINPNTLLNLKEQIAITTADKFKFKLDEIKKSIDNEYLQYKYECDDKHFKTYMPFEIERTLDEIVKIEFNNNIIREKIENNTYIEEQDGILQDMPEWYSKKLEEIFLKNDLYKSLIQAEDVYEAIEIAKELQDDELLDILNEEQENLEEEEEEYE